MKIALIGMPTSGKSTVSKLVCDQTGYCLVDVDELLEQQIGTNLQHFIDSSGEEEFLIQENNLLLNINYPDECIISTGGSVVYAEEAMEYMKSEGIHFVYLQVPISDLEARLSTQRDTRGIVMNGSATWGQLLEDRHGLYLKYSDTVINTLKKSPKKISGEILKLI